MRKIEPSESAIQCAIVEWANATRMPEWGNKKIGDFLFAIPNGGNRSITEAVRLKKEGVKKGVSDLFMAFPVKERRDRIDVNFHGLWIEVKSRKGIISKEQAYWLALMEELKYEQYVVKSVDEGIQAIKDYLGMK